MSVTVGDQEGPADASAAPGGAGTPPGVGRAEIGRGVVWAAASNIVMRVAGILVTALVARILTPEEFGVFAVALAVFFVVTSLAELGMASAVARSALEPSDIAGTVTSISIGVSFSLAGLLALFASPVASVLGVPDAAEPIRILSISLALTGLFAVPGAQLTREFRQDRIFLATFAGFVPANAVLIGLALMGGGATAFAWSRVIGQIITGLLFVAFVRHRYRPEWRPRLVGPLIRFGLPLSLANLINWSLLNADYVIIGRLLSATDVGVYMIAFTVSNWSTAVLGSVLNGVVVPAFGRVGGDLERLREALVSASRMVALVALPIAATSIGLAPSLVDTLFGSTWSEAAPVLGILSLYGAAFAFTLLFVNVLVATGATRQLLVIQVAWIGALVPAMVVGIEVDGLVGAAWAHVVVIAGIAVPGYLWAMRTQLGALPRSLGTTLLRPAAAAAAAGSAAWLTAALVGTSAVGFVGGGVVAVLVYLALARGMIEEALPEVGRRLRLSGRRTVHDEPAAPLRVGLVLEGLALGGCPIYAVDLARTLRGRGHGVHLLAVDEDVQVSFLPYARAAGFDVVLLPASAGLLARARQLRRYADEHDLQVIHVFAPWLGRAAVLASGVRRRRVAVVLNWMMANEYPTTSRTSLVVGTVGLHEEALREHGPRSWLLEPPVDLAHDRPDPEAGAAFRAEHGIGAADVLVTLVGRVDRVMKLPGILTAIEAVVHLDDPRLRLAVVGDGNAMDQVRDSAARANASLGREAIVLTGVLADPHPAYAAADIGLAMGGSAIRVLAHGCPLVVLGENGYSRLFEPGSADHFLAGGFFGTDEQPEPAARLADQLRLDPEARRTLGAWGLGVAEERFGLESAATRLELIYRDSLASASAAPVRALDDAYLVSRHALGVARRRAAPHRATT